MRGSLGGKIRCVSLIRVGGGGGDRGAGDLEVAEDGGVAFVDKFSVDSVIVRGFCSLTKGTISAWGGGDTASSSSLIALPKERDQITTQGHF